MTACCNDDPLAGAIAVLPVGARQLSWLLSRCAADGVALMLMLGEREIWPVRARADVVALLGEPPERAWIVQRPGCSGLASALALARADGVVSGVLRPDRAPGSAEPMAWRVALVELAAAPLAMAS
jgi:putative heme degradation protein